MAPQELDPPRAVAGFLTADQARTEARDFIARRLLIRTIHRWIGKAGEP